MKPFRDQQPQPCQLDDSAELSEGEVDDVGAGIDSPNVFSRSPGQLLEVLQKHEPMAISVAPRLPVPLRTLPSQMGSAQSRRVHGVPYNSNYMKGHKICSEPSVVKEHHAAASQLTVNKPSPTTPVSPTRPAIFAASCPKLTEPQLEPCNGLDGTNIDLTLELQKLREELLRDFETQKDAEHHEDDFDIAVEQLAETESVFECYPDRSLKELNICLDCCTFPHRVQMEGNVPVGHTCHGPPTILVCPNTRKAVELKCPKCMGKEPIKIIMISVTDESDTDEQVMNKQRAPVKKKKTKKTKSPKMARIDAGTEETPRLTITEHLRIKWAILDNLVTLKSHEKEEKIRLKVEKKALEKRKDYFKREQKNMTPEHKKYISEYLLIQEAEIKLKQRAAKDIIKRERAKLQSDLRDCTKQLKEMEEKETQMLEIRERQWKAQEKQAKKQFAERERQLKTSMKTLNKHAASEEKRRLEVEKERANEEKKRSEKDLMEKKKREKEELVEKKKREKEELVEKEKREKEELVAKKRREKEELKAKKKRENEELVAKKKREKEELVEKTKREKKELVEKKKREKEELVEKEKREKEELVAKKRRQKEELKAKKKRENEELVAKKKREKEELVEKKKREKEELVAKKRKEKEELKAKKKREGRAESKEK